VTAVKILYRNWKGQIAVRSIEPSGIWYGTTQWHPESQWFLRALDLDKNEWRDFALRDVREWEGPRCGEAQ
jgi:predicted DNA-binding transcriptional regulator YafY